MTKSVLWIRTPASDNEILAAELESRGFSLLVGTHQDDAALHAAPDTTAAIIRDAAHLNTIGPLRERLKKQGDTAPLLVTSSENAMEVRLDALRQGADAFFAPLSLPKTRSLRKTLTFSV